MARGYLSRKVRWTAALTGLVGLLFSIAVKANDEQAERPRQPQPTTVAPSSAPASDDSLVEYCLAKPWRLGGADLKPGKGEDVVFKPEWLPVLQELASCLELEPLRRACVDVQGQYDSVPFQYSAAVGSDTTAQLLRANGRALRTEAELVKLGVASYRVRAQHPPATATFRGVELTIQPDCLPPLPFDDRAAPETAREATEKSPSTLTQRADGAGGRSAPPRSVLPTPSSAKKPKVWVEVGAAAKWLFVEPENNLATGLRPGIGWHAHSVYARAFIGLSYGFAEESHRDLEFGLGAGYDTAWLEVGLLAGYGRAAPGFLKSEREQLWFLGYEGGLRLLQHQGWGIWVRSCFAPMGQREQRGVAPSGEDFTVLDRVVRLDGSLVLRGDIR